MRASSRKLRKRNLTNRAIVLLIALLVLSVIFALAYEYYAPRRAAEKLYSEAQRAVQKGDLKMAEKKLKELLNKDPGFPGARSELARVENEIKKSSGGSGEGLAGNAVAGGALNGSAARDPSGNGVGGSSGEAVSGSGDGSSNGGSASNGGTTNGGTIQNPSTAAALPGSISGFTLVDQTKSPMEEFRAYKPDEEGIVKLMTVVARNSGNGEAAQNYIDSAIKLHYSENAKSALVKQKNAYFGTDNSGFAVLAWRVAGTVVVIEMQASGVQPRTLYDQLMSVANQFP